MTTVLLVHGAWHGAWSWSRLQEALRAQGVASATVELPSVGDPRGDLAADVAAVRHVAEGLEGPLVLVGHSYGGAVITQAGSELPQVQRLVYVTAFVPDAGESLLDQVTYGPLTWIVPAGEGLLGVEAGREVELFYGDLPGDEAAAAVVRLRPQAAASFAAPVQRAAWHDLPSTYVVCTEDRCIPPEAQRRWSARCQDVVELPSSHSPFLSHADGLAAVLTARLT